MGIGIIERRPPMPKLKPVLHMELMSSTGNAINASDEIELSEEHLDWLAEFFAPMIKRAMMEKEKE